MMLGAVPEGSATRFRVWAPRVRRLEVELVRPAGGVFALAPTDGGYWEGRVEGVATGARYFYVLDGERRRPDPASRAQPEGVHGPSEVVDPAAFQWRHPAVSRPLEQQVLYELHVGTFSPEGTIDGARAQLGRLADLGVTAVELMPVASFPGRRNWGYDGVGWFAPQHSYGGPDGLRRFVDECHRLGLSAFLDVVYNHLGPEGNYLAELGPYFTERHATPWGAALNYDGPLEESRPVRELVKANARMWIEDYRFDGLRLDAVHAIVDESPEHIVAELTDELHGLATHHHRQVQIIAESDLGDIKVIESRAESSQAWGCDAQWADDFHHALHAVVTGERHRYYADFGAVTDVARALTDGFVYTGQPSPFRGRPFGTVAKHLPGERFVLCAQNHDQVGNRARGERLGQLKPGCEHAVAAAYLLAPSLPMLFQGEEHADPAPFLYFTDHGDVALQRAVSEGRRREFGIDPSDAAGIPDPQAEATFERSRVDLRLADGGRHAGVWRFYQALLQLRAGRASLRSTDRTRTDARGDDNARTLLLRRWMELEETLVVIALSPRGARVVAPAPRLGGWRLLADAGDPRFEGPSGTRLTDRDGALEILLPGWGAVILSNR